MASAPRAFCSTSSTVTPSRLMPRITSRIRRAAIGASPMLGSSSASSVGRLMSARPIASICCSPPESVPATCARRSARRGKRPNTRARSAAIPESDLEYAPIARFSSTERRENTPRPSGTRTRPARARRNAGSFETSRSPNRIDPVAGARPAIARSVEDFPAPFAPIRQTSSP